MTNSTENYIFTQKQNFTHHIPRRTFPWLLYRQFILWNLITSKRHWRKHTFRCCRRLPVIPDRYRTDCFGLSYVPPTTRVNNLLLIVWTIKKMRVIICLIWKKRTNQTLIFIDSVLNFEHDFYRFF